MFDKQSRIRRESRSRALRAARERASRRQQNTAAPATASAEESQPVSCDSAADPQSVSVGCADDSAETPPHDVAGSLGLTGLISLNVIFAGLVLTLLFMLA